MLTTDEHIGCDEPHRNCRNEIFSKRGNATVHRCAQGAGRIARTACLLSDQQPWSATKRAAAREGRSQNQQNHQRFLNAAPALFARAKLAWFCSAPVAQRIVLVRFKRALPPGTYGVSWSCGRFNLTVS
jgi:hypothetical protein